MRTTPRATANRRNAKLSTGPKSSAGKTRAAQNAVRHSLAIPVTNLPELKTAADRLSTVLADSFPAAEEAARVAEAQVDVTRVRRVRSALLAQAFGILDGKGAHPGIALSDIVRDLERIDRYERLSRRKFAIRVLTVMGEQRP